MHLRLDVSTAWEHFGARSIAAVAGPGGSQSLRKSASWHLERSGHPRHWIILHTDYDGIAKGILVRVDATRTRTIAPQFA